MTVVNAIRFNENAGAMVCDEQVSWGNMERKGDVGDKIQTIIPSDIIKRYGIAAAYGGSGTSSISEQIKKIAFNMMRQEDKKRNSIPGPFKEDFLTIQEIADRLFSELSAMKRHHVDEFLFRRYGFRGRDLIRGFYEQDGNKIDIKQKEIISDSQAAMTWKGGYSDLQHLFVNRGILAGYEPKEGFRIFYFNMMTFSYEPVQAVFQSIGSGQDTSDLAFADFVSSKTVEERRMKLDPVDSMISIIHATNLASTNNIGVGGYFNIIIIDGKKSRGSMLNEIGDERAKLASETVGAYKTELIPKKLAYDTIGNLIFGNVSFSKIENDLFKKSKDRTKLSRFMRGYKIQNSS